ncbi:MAG TPA: helix-turn-helix domain-containing protein [Tepidisphaeraceae bacterium]|jgi:DNA-binding transcriptional ArsR family regulator|nr:helix-turn-helix domain-containing protein [Tepidisphaeraceae bacterium]
MRPLYHPAIEAVTVQGILYALSDPARVRIFTQLSRSQEAERCCNFSQSGEVELPKSTLSQHFKILREAGLIRSERKGVELLNRSRCSELKRRFGPMITEILRAYDKEKP